MSAWLWLLGASAFEVGFTTCLKLEQQDKRWIIGFIVCAVMSFGMLSVALEGIHLGTAYAVWTGIGAIGTALVSARFFGERLPTRAWALLGVMVSLIVGLKVVEG